MSEYVVDPATWKRVTSTTGCIVHTDPDECSGPLQSHHVVSQQQLRKRGLGHLLWDVRNGVGICERAHTRHTLAKERIPRGRLPQHCFDFAEEQGLGWILERFYSGVKCW